MAYEPIIDRVVQIQPDGTVIRYVKANIDSGDPKPMKGIAVRSELFERDTGKLYLFTEEGKWVVPDDQDIGNIDEKIAEVVDDWLENNVAQETGYVLDRNLELENAAAPADLVGELQNQFHDGYEWHNFEVDKNISATDGSLVYKQNYCVSPFIPYTWSGNSAYYVGQNPNRDFRIAFYDSSKVLLTSFIAPANAASDYRGLTASDAPNGTAYVRFSFNKDYKAYCTGVEGSYTIRRWEASTKPVYSTEELSINKKGINTLNSKIFGSMINAFRSCTYISNTGSILLQNLCYSIGITSWLDIVKNTSIDNNGIITGAGLDRSASDYLDVSGYSSIISKFDDDDPILAFYAIHCYNSNKESISRADPEYANFGCTLRAFPENTKYVRFLFINQVQSVENIVDSYQGRILEITLTDSNSQSITKKICLTQAASFQ